MSTTIPNLSATSTGGEPTTHVCLITPGNLSSTPRLLREAQTLMTQGYQVSVIAGSRFTPLETADQVLAEKYGFTLHRPNRRSTGWLVIRFFSRLARILTACSIRLPINIRMQALDPMTTPLSRLARQIKADLYHGHCLAGLCVATNAAQYHGVPAGFDIEDYHADEQCWQGDEQWKPQAIHDIMEQRLPHCSHVTSASPGIQQACRDRYGVDSKVLLNTYPLSESPPNQKTILLPGPEFPARLYWFSQTIGPGRGLEQALHVISRMHTPCQLHLRGYPQHDFVEQLEQLAQKLGIDPASLVYHPPAAADCMVELCAGYHLGLNLEETTPKNRNLCLTNKIFAYLAAGTPVWLSTTQAHQNLYPELKPAACLTDMNAVDAAAQQLDSFLSHEDSYKRAQNSAWKLGRERFHWEHDAKNFLKNIQIPLNVNEKL